VRRLPLTLVIGAAIILICEALLYIDVRARGGVVVGPAYPDPALLPDPTTRLGEAARNIAYNITPLCWLAYLLLCDGLLTLVGGKGDPNAVSSLRRRPGRFLVAWLTSIPVWCFFDWVNFARMHAWTYYALPPYFIDRLVGYFVAFAAISPGMFLAAQLYQYLGLRKLRTRNPRGNRIAAVALGLGAPVILGAIIALTRRMQPQLHADLSLGPVDAADVLVVPGVLVWAGTRRLRPTSLAVGLTFTAWAIGVANPLGNLGLWVGLIYLLDPVNAWLGGPALLRDWEEGRWGRFLSLMLGGITCGLLWEFWNYWALSKWTYNLPFLGGLERYRYFEMPWLGFLGFLPFALECWIALNTLVLLLDRLRWRVAEALRDEVCVM
jgi:hypothetical protein